MAPKADRTPLTDEQRELAGNPRHIQMARTLAWKWRRRYPWLADDIDSAALEGVVKAARAFRPERGLAFNTLLGHCVIGRIHDFIRSFNRPKGYRRGTDDIPATEALKRDDWRSVPADHDGPVGWALDSADTLDGWTRDLSEPERQVVRTLYGRAGATVAGIGREMGFSENWVSHLHMKAVRFLREKHAGVCP